MPNDAYFEAPAPSTERMLEPLLSVMSVPRGAATTPEQQLALDRGELWWSSLPLWQQLAWSEQPLAAPPRPTSPLR